MNITRRRFLAASACTAFIPGAALSASPLRRDPFTLGVASGYPHPSGATLWTRLAPDPLHGGGMGPEPVEVEWQCAADGEFQDIVQRGRAIALPQWAHSVHVDLSGLAPEHRYSYRFRALGVTSPSGRFRTPSAADDTRAVRLAFACCQQYEQGYFAAYRHMANEALDGVVHLGDYIYESSWGRKHVRSHDSDEPRTLAEYRNRHALYKTDPDLQSAHAAFPWIVTWDDHEVQNDYANDRSQFLEDRDEFLERRAAAYQAYYEHMPLPAWARPHGPNMRLYARQSFGRLLQLHVLDDRQYRSHQVCARPGHGGSNVVSDDDCPQRLDPRLTLLGMEQEQWLREGLAASKTRWNIIAQQTLMAQADRNERGDAPLFWTDGWDGYPRARERLLRFIAQQGVRNVVVMSGDVHMAVVADLKSDFDDRAAPTIASEIVTPAITSEGPSRRYVQTMLANNPHIKFADAARHGYVTLEVRPDRCIARIRAVSDVADPYAGIRDLATFAIERDHPGAQRIKDQDRGVRSES